MNYEFLIILVVLTLAIIDILINSIKKVKPLQAYVIERVGKFHRVAQTGIAVIIPFLEKVSYIVNLEKTQIEMPTNIVVLSDGKTIKFNSTIYFRVADVQKVVCNTESLNQKLEFLNTKLFHEIAVNFDSSNIEYISKKVEAEMLLKMDLEMEKIGLKIDDIEIQIEPKEAGDNNGDEDIENIERGYSKTDVVINYKTYRNNQISKIIKIVVGLLIVAWIFTVHSRNNYLVAELIRLIIEDCLVFFTCIIIVVGILKNLNKKKRTSNKGIFTRAFGIAFILLCGYNILNIPTGTKANMLNYSIAIFKDAIINETTISTVKATSIITSESRLSASGSSRNYYSAYISYKVKGNTYFYSSRATDNLVEIMNELTKLENEIIIEYYTNSRIIKSIDGISKFDYDKLKERIEILQEQKAIEQEQARIEEEKAKQEEQKKQEEERKLRLIEYQIKQNSIGKNIDTVKKELEENGISNCPIKYISTKLYSVGTVAFVEREERGFN